jgi:hypothetical protein
MEYLTKKVEALEILYKAEKERVEALQATCDNLAGLLGTISAMVDGLRQGMSKIQRWFQDVPHIDHY